MLKKKMKEKYLKINAIKKTIKNILKEDDIEDKIKEAIDNKFLKFIQIKKGIIIFKANKKMRDEIDNDSDFLNEYMNDFLSSVFSEYDKISKKNLSIILKATYFNDDNKIYIEI